MNNYNYDQELRALGYVDSGLSGCRGDYFIFSYRPGARHKQKLKEGRVEVHCCRRLDIFHITTPLGTFTDLANAVVALR